MNEDALKIVRLFLEKLENLTKREREVIIRSVDLLNHPVFVTN